MNRVRSVSRSVCRAVLALRRDKALTATISETILPGPKEATSLRNGRSVIPAIGAKKTLLSKSSICIQTLKSNSRLLANMKSIRTVEGRFTSAA